MKDGLKELKINRDDRYMTFADLDEKGIFNAFTLRPYNFNQNYIDDLYIRKQYAKLEAEFGKQFRKIVKPVQTHTNTVKVLNEENLNDEFKDVDGLVTDLSNVCLVTSLADCQGVLFYDPKKGVIGNVHSGWKGTLNKIGKNAIDLMVTTYGTDPRDLNVYIFPSILKCCFEVDEDVMQMFVDAFQEIDIDSCISAGDLKEGKQKYFIDTVRINQLMFERSGILPENIHLSNTCSKCHKDEIHSHRGHGARAGRNIAMISK